jgi:hypothetical protein
MTERTAPGRSARVTPVAAVFLMLAHCNTLAPLPVASPALPTARATDDATPVTIDTEGPRAAVGRVVREQRHEVDFAVANVRRETESICVTPCTVLLPRGHFLVQLEPVAGDPEGERATAVLAPLRIGRTPTAFRAHLGYRRETSDGGMKAAMWTWIGGALVGGFGAGAVGLGLTGTHESLDTKQEAVLIGGVALGISAAILALGTILIFASRPLHREGVQR